MGPFERLGRSVGGVLGNAYLGPAGGAIGSKLGSYLHYIGKIFGSGDYTTSSDQVRYNVIVNDSQVPQFASSKNIIHIRHREYLGDIITSATPGAFESTSYAVNPGLPATFPWLAQVCGASFQQYRINGMVFEYRTMSADALNSTNTALGTVVIATDYDSSDALFLNKAQMENTEFGVSCKPSSCMIHAIECARNQTTVSELYIRSGDNPPGTDIRLYDLCRTTVATQGFQAASVNIGELWVSYDITLFKPIQQIPGTLCLNAHYQLSVNSVDAYPIQVSAKKFDNIGLTFDGGNTVTFPANAPTNSHWCVLLQRFGDAGNDVRPPVVAFTNGVIALRLFVSNSSYIIQSPFNVPSDTALQYQIMMFVQLDGSNVAGTLPTMTFTDGVGPAACQGADLFVMQVNAQMT